MKGKTSETIILYSAPHYRICLASRWSASHAHLRRWAGQKRPMFIVRDRQSEKKPKKRCNCLKGFFRSNFTSAWEGEGLILL
jgi:hypothetical protein